MFRVLKRDTSKSPSQENEKPKVDSPSTPTSPQQNVESHAVRFDPKNEGIKVYLASIIKGNRRKKPPGAGVMEEFNEDIKSKNTKLIYSGLVPGGLQVEDVLRVSLNHTPQQTGFLQLEMYPIRTKG